MAWLGGGGGGGGGGVHVISNKVFNVSIARYAFPTGPTVFFVCVCCCCCLFVWGGGGNNELPV